VSQEHYKWDSFSDQPYTIEDKQYKKKVRQRALLASLKMLFVNLLVMPFVSLRYLFFRTYSLPVSTSNMIGLCVNVDKSPESTLALVEDLHVQSLSIRILLSDIENLQNYYDFIVKFSSYDLLIVIIQDREHIQNKDLCQKSFRQIFKMFKPLCQKFQIGNAINRTKWGFDSVDEYLAFYEIAFVLNKEENFGLDLFGSSVIDFEFYATVRALFNFKHLSYSGLSSLLYVDRRGAPENRQFIFDLPNKILLLNCIAALSPKVGRRHIISETNWPIEHTEPYAPALDDVWVSEQRYADYLCRYYLLAMSAGSVETIYWHQLIAPGYGLIDNRDGQLVKRKAYSAFKTLINFFSDVSIQSIDIVGQRYCVNATDPDGGIISAIWLREGTSIEEVPTEVKVYDAVGEAVFEKKMELTESITYLLWPLSNNTAEVSHS
jgi:hypothetical protein